VNERTAQAYELMMRFLDSGKRYLWTDAFAVCNLIGLHREDLARDLVDRVTRTLGVTKGLRIGKPLPEREPDEPFDEQLEWERDGQYFHYLTKWMHALDAIGDHERAVELAKVAHDGFVYESRGRKRMYWKMSVDLSRPLVPSMGHHDPLDGYITAVQLRDVPRTIVDDYAAMIDRTSLATTDPLGLGGLLFDVYRAHLLRLDIEEPLLTASRMGLAHITLGGPAERRLAFRELGLAIGLAAIERLGEPRFIALREQIEHFWLEPTHRASRTYREHADINDVMLATALVPDGYFALR
jgi:hypothetical protein